MAKLKKKMKVYDLYNGMMKSSLYLIVNCSFEDFKKKAEKIVGGNVKWPENSTDNNNAIGYTCTLFGKVGLRRFIWIGEFEWRVEEMAILSHEVLHHIAQVCEEKEIEFSIKNQEILAYFYEYTYGRCLNVLKPKKKNG